MANKIVDVGRGTSANASWRLRFQRCRRIEHRRFALTRTIELVQYVRESAEIADEFENTLWTVEAILDELIDNMRSDEITICEDTK